jgi:hypothetical protein
MLDRTDVRVPCGRAARHRSRNSSSPSQGSLIRSVVQSEVTAARIDEKRSGEVVDEVENMPDLCGVVVGRRVIVSRTVVQKKVVPNRGSVPAPAAVALSNAIDENVRRSRGGFETVRAISVGHAIREVRSNVAEPVKSSRTRVRITQAISKLGTARVDVPSMSCVAVRLAIDKNGTR